VLNLADVLHVNEEASNASDAPPPSATDLTVSMPDVHVNGDAMQLRLYFCVRDRQSSNVATRVAVSSDGLSFIPLRDPICHSSSMRVFHWRDTFYGLASDGMLWRSKDGLRGFQCRLTAALNPDEPVHKKEQNPHLLPPNGAVCSFCVQVHKSLLYVYLTLNDPLAGTAAAVAAAGTGCSCCMVDIRKTNWREWHLVSSVTNKKVKQEASFRANNKPPSKACSKVAAGVPSPAPPPGRGLVEEAANAAAGGGAGVAAGPLSRAGCMSLQIDPAEVTDPTSHDHMFQVVTTPEASSGAAAETAACCFGGACSLEAGVCWAQSLYVWTQSLYVSSPQYTAPPHVNPLPQQTDSPSASMSASPSASSSASPPAS
jgi:hypothetical protein